MFENLLDYHQPRSRDPFERVAGKMVCSVNVIYPVHAQDITDKAMISFKNHTIMPRYVDRQYDKLWGQSGAKRGTTINLRYPPQYELRRGDHAEPQGSNESFFPVTMGEPVGVDLDFTSQELLLTVDDFMNRFIKPATLPIANACDSDLAGLYKYIFNYVGTPGTIPATIETYLNATSALASAGAPVEGDEWSMIIDYKSNAKIINALAGQYNPQGTISRQWDSARMVSAAGYKWSQDQNIRMHTVGALGGTPIVAGVGQSGASINIDGCGAAAVTRYWGEGDVIQFAGVYGIKPQSVPLNGVGESTGDLMNFRITADINLGAGPGTITALIDPPIILTGATQNVTNAPGDNVAVTTFGHASAYAGVVTRQNMAFQKSALVLGNIDLPLPGGMDMAARTTDEDTKLSMRFLRGFDITENVYISRLDMLYVVACPRPQFGCRVVG